jgi:hypothetical protein
MHFNLWSVMLSKYYERLFSQLSSVTFIKLDIIFYQLVRKKIKERFCSVAI